MMKDYEDRKYKQWREATEQLLPALMKKSLLTRVRPRLPVPDAVARGVAGIPLLTLVKVMGISKVNGWETRRTQRQQQPASWVTMTRLGHPRPSGPQSRNQGLSSLRRQCFGVRGQNMWQRLPMPPATCRTTLPAFTAPFLCPHSRWTCPKADRA